MLPAARVPAAIRSMGAPSGVARFAAGKALCATAAKDPERVYPHFDELVRLLESSSKVVRWNAIQLLGLLAPVDKHRRLDEHLDRYLALITGGNLVSAANAIQGAARIGLARPELLDRIIPAILAVAHANYETPMCRTVAIRHARKALTDLGPQVGARADVARFLSRPARTPLKRARAGSDS